MNSRRVFENAKLFRTQMRHAGFDVRGENLPNCPVFVGDHRIAKEIADEMHDNGILVQPLYYPYVPNDRAYLRVNMNAGHSVEDIQRCVETFIEVCRPHNLLNHNKIRHTH